MSLHSFVFGHPQVAVLVGLAGWAGLGCWLSAWCPALSVRYTP